MMASLFISYSRKDLDAARKLTDALKGPDLDFWIDWEGIPPTVDWWQEIEKGIEETDIFLFLLSPDSAGSQVCRKEIEHAAKNGKRLIPVVVQDIPASEAPSELRSLNWIFLREQDNFRAAFSKLIKAIKTDYAWAQAHRQLQVKALEWKRSGHKNDLLLHGEELRDAEQQLVTNASKEPHPTDLQRDYVLHSRRASDRQRRIFSGAAIVIAIAMTGLALFGFDRARRATANASVAETQRSIAEANENLAEERANIALARQLAAQAQVVFPDKPELSLLLAIESAQTSKKSLASYLPVTAQALWNSVSQIQIAGRPLPNTTKGAGDHLVVATFSPDARWMATGSSGGEVFLWDLKSSSLQPIVFTDPTVLGAVNALAISPDSRWLASTSGNRIYFWEIQKSPAEAVILETDSDLIDILAFSPDGRWLETEIGVWNLQDLPKRPTLFQRQDGFRQIADLSPDGHWMAVSSISEDQQAVLSLRDLRDATAAPILLYTGTAFLSQLAFSPRGRWLAAAGSNQNSIFHYWDLQDISREPANLDYHGGVGSLIFSPDDRQLAISNGNKISVWNLLDLSTGSKVMEGWAAWFFTNDGRWLFANTGVWDVNDPSANPIPLEAEMDFLELDLSPNGEWFFTSNTCYVHLWNTQDLFLGPLVVHGHELRSCGPVPNGNWITSHAFSPDGHWLVTTDANSATWLWDLEMIRRAPITLTQGAMNETYFSTDNLIFSPDSQWLITGSEVQIKTPQGYSWKGEVRIWNLHDFDQKPILLPSSSSLIPSPDGRWLGLKPYPANPERVVGLWDLQNIAGTPQILKQADGVIFSPDGRWLVTLLTDAEQNFVARLGDLQDLSKEFVLLQNGERMHTLVFSLDGHWLATGTRENQIRLLDLDRQSRQWMELPHHGDLDDLIFSRSGRWLATISGDDKKTIDLWETGTLSLKQTSLPIEIDLLKFSPDERWLAARVLGETGIHLIDINHSLRKIILPGMEGDYPRNFDFSLNGQWLAAASENGDIRLWNTWDPEAAPIVIQGNREPVDQIVFSDDDRLLVVGTLGGSIILRDMQDVLAEPIILDHPNSLSAMAISADGQWLATVGGGYPLLDSGDHAVRLWHLNLNEVLSIACQVVGRNLTRREWAQYFPNDRYRKTCQQWPLEPENTPAPVPTP